MGEIGFLFALLEVSEVSVVGDGDSDLQQGAGLIGECVDELLLKDSFDFADDEHFPFFEDAVSVSCVERIEDEGGLSGLLKLPSILSASELLEVPVIVDLFFELFEEL